MLRTEWRALRARMRASWAAALSEKPGFEIVAVPTLRNSLMSATIGASTAALAVMGTITLAGGTVLEGISHPGAAGEQWLRPVLEAPLMPFMIVGLVFVLRLFDRSAKSAKSLARARRCGAAGLQSTLE